MTNSIALAMTRSLRKVLATNVTPVPQTSQPSGAGVFAVSDALDWTKSFAQGVPPKVRFLGGRTGGSGTYTLLVFGWLPDYSPTTNAITGWVPFLLYKASVASTVTPGGTADSNGFAASDKAAGVITVDPEVTAGIHQTMSGGTDGLSHILLDCRGCPLISFVSADTAAYVLVGPAS